MLARQSVVGGLKNDPDLAFRFLCRKAKDEFSEKLETVNTHKLSLTDALRLLQKETINKEHDDENRD